MECKMQHQLSKIAKVAATRAILISCEINSIDSTKAVALLIKHRNSADNLQTWAVEEVKSE